MTYSTNPSVGIVTRTKNRIVLLRRALESVRNQTHENWRLVVVNDGGVREDVNWIVSAVMGENEPRVSVIHHEQSKGMEAASNAGLALLDTDLAIIHDDDDSWAPAMLSIATQVLAHQNRQFASVRGVAVGVNAVYETVSGNHIRTDHVAPWFPGRVDDLGEGILDITRMMKQNQFPPIAFLFDLQECRNLGMFNADLPVLGDWDFHLKFCRAFDIWMHPERLAFYHHRPSAKGVMGNTVHAGNKSHQIYNTLLRNNWIREAVQGSTEESHAAFALLREQAGKEDRFDELVQLQQKSLSAKLSREFRKLKAKIRRKKNG